MTNIDITCITVAFLLLSLNVMAKEKIQLAQPIDCKSKYVEQVKPSSIIDQMINAVQQVDEVALIDAIVASYPQISRQEFAKLMCKVIEKTDLAHAVEFTTMVISKLPKEEAIAALAAIVEKLDLQQSIDFAAQIATAAKIADKVKDVEWYEMHLFDSGTGYWAAIERAKHYISVGDVENASKMKAICIQMLKDYQKKDEE